MKNVDTYEIRKVELQHTCSVDDRAGITKTYGFKCLKLKFDKQKTDMQNKQHILLLEKCSSQDLLVKEADHTHKK
ncbi:hypothetical protein YC2023_121964 [Brassica napus]